MSQMSGLGWVSHEHFAGRVGEPFDVLGAGAMRLELVETTESTESGGPGPSGEQRQQFSLVFRGPAAPVLPQGTHALHHDALGDLDLFLVPLGPDSDGMRYEAAFA
jgi:hypothetical protein